MRLTEQDLDLIAGVAQAQKRAKLVRAMLFVCVLFSLVAFSTGILSLDYLAYSLVAIVLIAIFVPHGFLRIDELAELLNRVKSEAEAPEKDELIQALSRK